MIDEACSWYSIGSLDMADENEMDLTVVYISPDSSVFLAFWGEVSKLEQGVMSVFLVAKLR